MCTKPCLLQGFSCVPKIATVIFGIIFYMVNHIKMFTGYKQIFSDKLRAGYKECNKKISRCHGLGREKAAAAYLIINQLYTYREGNKH